MEGDEEIVESKKKKRGEERRGGQKRRKRRKEEEKSHTLEPVNQSDIKSSNPLQQIERQAALNKNIISIEQMSLYRSYRMYEDAVE